ncbi:MAG: hypothetical protein P1T08_12215 [Acidimicrobiia bacterium]|nr:hypothetical protein [Acidimicrobiia bacterium]
MTGEAQRSQTPVALAVAAATLGAGMAMLYVGILMSHGDVWLPANPFVLALATGAGFAYAAAIPPQDRLRF